MSRDSAQNLWIVFGGERRELSPPDAAAVADHLWKGLRPGAVTSAAKLTAALRLLKSGEPQVVELEEYEIETVGYALATIGLG